MASTAAYVVPHSLGILSTDDEDTEV
jgi:hypothetical protein